ncbi:hypothetical protein FACS1894218_3620 [Bacilli bacterium]|nr:hypothetical protein FACS1894218_3620 [Bacilli bacterium]
MKKNAPKTSKDIIAKKKHEQEVELANLKNLQLAEIAKAKADCCKFVSELQIKSKHDLLVNEQKRSNIVEKLKKDIAQAKATLANKMKTIENKY